MPDMMMANASGAFEPLFLDEASYGFTALKIVALRHGEAVRYNGRG